MSLLNNRRSNDTLRIENFLSAGLDWIIENIAFFNPFQENDKDDVLRSKMFLELSSTCMLYYRELPNPDERIIKILHFLKNICEQPAYNERLLRFPQRFRLYAMPIIALEKCGIKSFNIKWTLQKTLNSGYHLAQEELPFQYIEVRYLLDICGIEHSLPSYKELYKRTLLANTERLIHFSNSDVYCITHTLFYLSNFGQWKIVEILGERQSVIQRMVADLLGLYIRRCNWDLVGELLISLHCLQFFPSILYETAWHVLLDAQRPDGSILGPTFDDQVFISLDLDQRRQYYFEYNYHTTIVAVLASILAVANIRKAS